MNNIKKISLSLAVITALGFSGCGSSDGDSNSNTNKSLSGNVADGYLVGAKVCLDKNKNAKCDSTEPSATTQAHGKYTIKNLSNDDISKYPILVEVDETVVDEDDNKTVSEYYTLSATPGQSFISPISTMIRNYETSNNVTPAEARSKVKELLGINDWSLTVSDYIKDNSDEAKKVHSKAKLIANLKMKILTNLGNKASTTESKVMNKYINDKIMAKLSNIKTEIDSNSLDLNTSINNIFGQIDLSSATTELTQIKNNLDKKELEDHLGTTIHDLTSSTTIKQDTKYKKTYNGGTDIRNYTIENSANKLCTMYILDTTNAFNPYGPSYKINWSDYTPTTTYNLGIKTTNNKFSISWMYYTYANSHVDFYVHCK